MGSLPSSLKRNTNDLELWTDHKAETIASHQTQALWSLVSSRPSAGSGTRGLLGPPGSLLLPAGAAALSPQGLSVQAEPC